MDHRYRLATFTLFILMFSVYIKPVVVKNCTKKSFFVISTYKNSDVRVGYKIKPEKEVNIDKIYTGTVSKELYSYPETLYFYNRAADVICNRTYGEFYLIEMEGYVYVVDLCEDISKLTILSLNKIPITLIS